MGRGGLYYRASLGPRSSRSQQRPTAQPSTVSSELSEVETGNVIQMVPTNAEGVLAQINDGISAWSLWPYPLILGAAGSYYLFSSNYPLSYLYSSIALTLFLTFMASYADMVRKTVVLMYDLEKDVEVTFGQFLERFAEIGDCQKIWNVDTLRTTGDWKRNAGATRLLKRTNARISFGCPSVIKTNIDIPCITGGKQNIYFFPDLILVMEGRKAGAVMYKNFSTDWDTTVFIETDGVPRDSQVVGRTWRYVNKKGGPDRRFNNNRQIPEVRYQTLTLSSNGGLHKLLHLSKVADRSTFDLVLGGVTDMVSRIPATGGRYGQPSK